MRGGQRTEHLTLVPESNSTDLMARYVAWPEHDQLPNEGAWVYAVDRAAWDAGQVCGAWLPVDLDPHQAALLISTVAARSLGRADIAVVDQIGCDQPIDENHFGPAEARPR